MKKKINTDISVATEYGASLLPKNANILCGRLDEEQISALMLKNRYDMVIDSTHPYAVEATRNIRSACNKIGTRYVRLIRKSVVSSGLIVKDMDELVVFSTKAIYSAQHSWEQIHSGTHKST